MSFNNSCFFQNRNCEFFPCHSCSDVDNFNCLFCYCPLYTLGDKCDGDFVITEGNVKDCSNCTRCHEPDFREYVIKRFGDIQWIENKIRDE